MMNVVEQLGLPHLARDLTRVERRLETAVAEHDALLGDSAAHLLRAGGKRLRPALTLSVVYTSAGVGEASSAAVTGAAAVELVHLGSLYHDDVIDEAETRRGVPSVNARWSNVVAILAGDYLLARASELAASLGADVAHLLARTIGELCRGQLLELEHLYDVGRSEESYRSAIAGKTASLMAAACRIGGMVSELDDETLDQLSDFGHHLGMCFQIVDDVLDITQTEAELGKPAGNDLHEGVYTLPVIKALRESDELRAMLGGRLDWPEVSKARSIVTSNGVVEQSIDLAREHALHARQALDSAGKLDTAVCDRLGELVGGLVTRSF